MNIQNKSHLLFFNNVFTVFLTILGTNYIKITENFISFNSKYGQCNGKGDLNSANTIWKFQSKLHVSSFCCRSNSRWITNFPISFFVPCVTRCKWHGNTASQVLLAPLTGIILVRFLIKLYIYVNISNISDKFFNSGR